MSASFTNWRGMQESAGRRIMRYINIDMLSVHFLSDEEIDTLRKSNVLKGYIEDMLPKLDEQNKGISDVLDKRKLTNLGVFRQYAVRWLEANPDLNIDMTYMVRQLQPTKVAEEDACKIEHDISDETFAAICAHAVRHGEKK